MGGCTKEQLLARLQELQISFASYDHPAVLTVEAQAKYVGHLGGALSKNLFLKDKKHRFYVVSALAGTTVDLKVLSQRLGLGKGGLRMAPEEALQEILQVPLGCVTPFALINESARTVSLLLDKGFKAHEFCFFHPLSNKVTISLNTCDLDKFLISIGRNPTYVDLEVTPLVGKDQPPDLAALVPSETPSSVGPPEYTVQNQAAAVNHAPILNKSINCSGETILGPNSTKVAKENTVGTAENKVAATDVRKLIDEIIAKTCAAVLTQISKDTEDQPEVDGSLLDKVSKHIGPDLENIAMSFKNAAYTEGFHAGIYSVINRGLQGLSSHR
uniref:Prolyl-tRNA synthetase associated domain-containing protein 1 n=1 Tax=Anthurium amnicola TaxID=1678845 RepID=A0A1D1XWU9_9ARAE